jgi:hypothetical protein
MEKVLQILLVFALLLLLIWRSIRGKENRFRRFSYLSRLREPAQEGVRERWIAGTFGATEDRRGYGVPDEADAYLLDEDGGLLFCYRMEGKLFVYHWAPGSRNRELQEMSVPMDCTGLSWDPVERKIYLGEGEYWYVYGPEG